MSICIPCGIHDIDHWKEFGMKAETHARGLSKRKWTAVASLGKRLRNPRSSFWLGQGQKILFNVGVAGQRENMLISITDHRE